jgi:hypothetical protein
MTSSVLAGPGPAARFHPGTETAPLIRAPAKVSGLFLQAALKYSVVAPRITVRGEPTAGINVRGGSDR